MKKLKVIVKNKNTLVLDEDGKKGDYIDLSEFMEIDSSEIENNISNGTDKVYAKKFEQYKDVVVLKSDKEIKELQNQIDKLKNEQSKLLDDQKHELEKVYTDKIHSLELQLNSIDSKKSVEINDIKSKHQIDINTLETSKDAKYKELEAKYSNLESSFDTKLNNESLKIKNQYLDRINELENKISLLDKDNQIKLSNKENELNEIKHKEIDKLKEQYNKDLKDKDDAINELTRQKASLNVKQTGEDLETWCNAHMIEAMENGFSNCEWIKDNKLVKDEDSNKSTKADYIFKIYSDKNKDKLLSSICFDMKDENPDSVNKKTNASYYATLDKNRTKKECKYAVLLSNLEMNNNLPMWKVREYEDMYVVRPAYLLTFINIVTSLNDRFANLILADKEQQLNLMASLDLEKEFNSLKETYLDKPLESLEKDIEAITKSTEGIINAADKINKSCSHITNSYVNVIQDKLSKFDIKIAKQYRKFDKESKDL